MRENEERMELTKKRMTEIRSFATLVNSAADYEDRVQTINCESGKTLRVTFELRKKTK
ncbi:MAG: hypothetical protein SGI77_05295 [Pirellulaceae bacterium]|nr:hypothetical protein [Pirellulaceae bacterium]